MELTPAMVISTTRRDNGSATATQLESTRANLGTRPAGWETVEIGALEPFVTSGSRGWARFYGETGAPFVRITNLSRDSIYLDLEDLKYVLLPPEACVEAQRTGLRDGDLLISITADIGIIGFVDSRVERPAFLNQHMALVRFDQARTNSKFVAYYLASERPQRLFVASMDVGAKAGMNLSTIRRIILTLPPLAEQDSIAEALADVDELLTDLDALKAKKRGIKQAVMQQLLTGETRLPGFNGEWEVKRVLHLGEVVTGGTPKTDVAAYWGGRFPWITPTDISIRRDMSTSERWLTRSGVDCVGALPPNTVLVTCIASIGKNAVLRTVGACNQQINAVIPNKQNDADFLYYMFEANKSYLLANAGATATSIISKAAFSTLSFRVPPHNEQIAIAAVLSAIDAELAALEARRNKTRDIKQGMMQQLFAGRTRIVRAAPEESVA